MAAIPDDLVLALARRAYLEGDFVLRSGQRSRYYFDKYLFESDPGLLGPVSRALAGLVPEGTELLAGPELGGVALAAATSLASGIPFVIVRKSAKDYGTSRRIEGPAVGGRTVTIVEDVLTTGGAALSSAIALQEAGATVAGIIAVVDREQGARETFEGARLPFQALVTRSELEQALGIAG